MAFRGLKPAAMLGLLEGGQLHHHNVGTSASTLFSPWVGGAMRYGMLRAHRTIIGRLASSIRWTRGCKNFLVGYAAPALLMAISSGGNLALYLSTLAGGGRTSEVVKEGQKGRVLVYQTTVSNNVEHTVDLENNMAAVLRRVTNTDIHQEDDVLSMAELSEINDSYYLRDDSSQASECETGRISILMHPGMYDDISCVGTEEASCDDENDSTVSASTSPSILSYLSAVLPCEQLVSNSLPWSRAVGQFGGWTMYSSDEEESSEEEEDGLLLMTEEEGGANGYTERESMFYGSAPDDDDMPCRPTPLLMTM